MLVCDCGYTVLSQNHSHFTGQNKRRENDEEESLSGGRKEYLFSFFKNQFCNKKEIHTHYEIFR